MISKYLENYPEMISFLLTFALEINRKFSVWGIAHNVWHMKSRRCEFVSCLVTTKLKRRKTIGNAAI